MEKKEHLRLLGDKQLSEIGAVKFNYGFPTPKESEEVPKKDYYLMAQGLYRNLESFNQDLKFKYAEKDPELDIPENIDYINITFFDQFNIDEYYSKWYNEFGLEGVSFQNFGRIVLFAIVDKEKFDVFIDNLKAFISFGLDDNKDVEFSKKIIYVKEFQLLTISDIIGFKPDEIGSVILVNTIDLPLDLPLEGKLILALEQYFIENDIEYIIDNDKFELNGATYKQIEIIAANFDIIESITCSLSGVVRPSKFNIVNRAYGFEINNADDDLPIIGIMDTGISMDTPLKLITSKDNSFTLAGNPLVDSYGGLNNRGHGTAVAGLAALGRENHLNDFSGTVNADAKLLSIKLTDNGKGHFSEKKIINMLYKVKAKYPQIKLFVLTISYVRFKTNNEGYSNYTYELDKFAHITDSLIFISTGNNDNAINENSNYNLSYFNSEHTNLSTPSDSMNSITVGAAADGLYSGVFAGISYGREYPALFSRKSHIDLKSLYPNNKSNKNFFKPDIIECGGDFGFHDPTTLDFIDDSAMTVISANPAHGYIKETGTSFSAPLAANLAAKLMKLYPSIHSQTIKALIINGASLNNIRYDRSVSHLLNKTAGNGFIDLDKTLFSDENSATLILEDSIENKSQKIYPLNFPKYLITDNLGKRNRILKVTATLCFSFEPIQHNQLSYCPIHLAFSVFRNHSSDQINAKKDDVNSNLRSNLSWSQSGRHMSKPVPYSNSQKIQFNVDVKQLIDEGSTFNLAVQARLTSQILKSEFENYTKDYPFSIVIRIEETLQNSTGKLYDELKIINYLEVITEADAEGTLEV